MSIGFKSTACQQHWALLVAGSMGYDNYRHQADVCHAYHVLRNHGFAKENIIVMMYDDIAHNEENPFPGQIINHPDGPNVYKGVPIDYSKDEVKPDVFLSVLSGDADNVERLIKRKGRVIKSGPRDNIFLNFVDHGAPGILAFPKEFLHADQFHAVLKKMYLNWQYNEMVMYIEACHAGSMFDGILEDYMNVFTTTAANPDESSYACYFDDKRQTFLGDVYSVNWMEDSDQENLNKETLYRQFKLVKQETNTSHVMEYGDMTLRKMKVAEFQGNDTASSLLFIPSRKIHPGADAVPSEDVPLEILKRKIKMSSGDEQNKHKAALRKHLERRQQTDKFFKGIAKSSAENLEYESIVNTPLHLTDLTCYQESIRLTLQLCPGLQLIQNDFALRRLKVLANLCENISQDKILAAVHKASFDDICSN